MIWLITYFIIGIIIGCSYYAWECHKYKKKYENKSWKLTWAEYSLKESVDMGYILTLFLWPACLIIVLIYIAYSVLTKYIRKYFGIE